MQVYFDNAATTPMDERVIEEMLPFFYEHYGNPSSIHNHGRYARSAIEKARKKIAELLNAAPSEIFFTSGGSEADNTAIKGVKEAYNIETIVSSPVEHDAVLNTVKAMENKVQVEWLHPDENGDLDPNQLDHILHQNPNALVTIMHGNNEIGNLNDIETIGKITKNYNAIFHSDTVQTMGQMPFNLQKLNVDFIVGSAHKFHGPKGTGFLYINGDYKIPPFIRGGGQERNMRAGTENVAGIVGLAKALELAHEDLKEKNDKILSLKKSLIEKLKEAIPEAAIIGNAENDEKSMNHIVNVSFPDSDINEMLLFNLDIDKISVSGGSACSSGASTPSHVLTALNVDQDRTHVRFSFSKYNTHEEVDYVVQKLKEMYS